MTTRGRHLFAATFGALVSVPLMGALGMQPTVIGTVFGWAFSFAILEYMDKKNDGS